MHIFVNLGHEFNKPKHKEPKHKNEMLPNQETNSNAKHPMR